MGFDAGTKEALAAPLSRANVKTRKQGPRNVSYIEGWKAIEEANRIFGFDGWTRETLEIKCVSEKDRAIGDAKAPGFGVSYTARIRITAHGVIREGIGAGHGIDRDLGQAHESAIKEAETDAMKRALMTFGNPFGLALYDKEQANVQDAVDPQEQFIETCKKTIDAFIDEKKLRDWWASADQKTARREMELSQNYVDGLLEYMKLRIAEIQSKNLAA